MYARNNGDPLIKVIITNYNLIVVFRLDYQVILSLKYT